jgi:hypothetical protein
MNSLPCPHTGSLLTVQLFPKEKNKTKKEQDFEHAIFEAQVKSN